jgi:hypothetical protein
MRRPDAFDRIAAVAQKFPATRRMGQALHQRPTLRRWMWFASIYIVSVIVFGAVAFLLNAIVPK